MKTNLSVLLVAFMLIFFAGCELTSPDQVDDISADTNELEILEPFEGEEKLLLQPVTPAKVDNGDQMIQIAPEFNAQEKVRTVTRGRRFGDDATTSSAQARFEASTIQCGTSLSASTEDYDINNENDDFYKKGDEFYLRHNLNTNLNGNDRSFYLFVSEPKLYTFRLSNTTKNLAMLIFSADISSPAENGTDEATEATKGLVAFSKSNSTRSERVGPVFLDKGEYLIVVDSKPGQGSDFDLTVSCKDGFTGCAGTFGTGLISETFEQYNVLADLTQASSNWEDYSPNKGNFAYVFTISRTNKVMRVDRRYSGTTFSPNEPNAIFLLGERNLGKYALEFDFGVYRGRSAYFNLINFLTERNENNEVGAELFFPSNGNGYIKIGGQTKNFTYANGYWQKVKLIWDFNTNKVSFYINNTKKAEWAANSLNVGGTGTRSVEGINFLPAFTNSNFVADNFCFSKD